MEKANRASHQRVSHARTSASSPDEEARRVPVDEESFMRYYGVAMKAASMEGPPPSVKARVMRSLNDTPGSVLDVVFGDNPLSRMAIALKNKMSEEQQMDKFPAVSTRILALIQLIGSGFLKRWVISIPRDPRHLYYPDAVVLAAAVSPLIDDLTFQMDEFERLVELRLGGINCGRFTAFV
ncbi:MAG: hypothetical protein ABSC57_11405 [Syntrophales bacterium]